MTAAKRLAASCDNICDDSSAVKVGSHTNLTIISVNNDLKDEDKEQEETEGEGSTESSSGEEVAAKAKTRQSHHQIARVSDSISSVGSASYDDQAVEEAGR